MSNFDFDSLISFIELLKFLMLLLPLPQKVKQKQQNNIVLNINIYITKD